MENDTTPAVADALERLLVPLQQVTDEMLAIWQDTKPRPTLELVKPERQPDDPGDTGWQVKRLPAV
jgi:hypothetical protein